MRGGGGWTREGFKKALGWIPFHLDQISAQTNHSGSISGENKKSIFFGNP